jgi:hypothetical protein
MRDLPKSLGMGKGPSGLSEREGFMSYLEEDWVPDDPWEDELLEEYRRDSDFYIDARDEEDRIAVLAAYYDTHDSVTGELLPENEWAHGSTWPPGD